MKHSAHIVLCVFVLLTGTVYSAVPPVSVSWGLRAGLVVPEHWGPAFGTGAHVNIAFDLARFGTACYYPSFDFFTRRYERRYVHDDYRLTELAFNIGDVRYYPPVPSTLMVKPYAGIGPGMVVQIYGWKEYEYRGDLVIDEYRYRDSDIDGLFNMMAGCDFELSSVVRLFAEIRGKFSDRHVFKFSGGIAFAL